MATRSRTLQTYSYRLGGTEVEHSVHDACGIVTTNYLVRVLLTLNQRWGVMYGSRLIDEAGATDYEDVKAKAEHAGPEITNGRDAMLYELAGSVRWAILARYADRAVGRPREPGYTWVLKTNTNYEGDSTGGNHLNFLMPLRSATVPNISAVAKLLRTFVATLELLVGAGAVIRPERAKTLIRGAEFGYVIGARGFHVSNYVTTGANNSSANGNKPIFLNRNEPLADTERFWRNQIVGLDSNILPSVIQLKMDLLFLMIEMALAGAVIPIQLWEPMASVPDQLGNVCSSMRAISCNWRRHLAIADGPQKEMTAREIQLYYYGLAEKYVYGQPTPDPAQKALLDQWYQLLLAFDTEEIIPPDAYGLSDWVTKAAWLARREDRADSALTYRQAQAVHLDYQGYRFGGGRRCTPLRLAIKYGHPGIWPDIVRALSTPPSDTRAWGRGQAVKLRARAKDLNPNGWTFVRATGIFDIPISDPRVPATAQLMRQLRRWGLDEAA